MGLLKVCRPKFNTFETLVRDIAVGKASVASSADLAQAVRTDFDVESRTLIGKLGHLAHSSNAERDYLRLVKKEIMQDDAQCMKHAWGRATSREREMGTNATLRAGRLCGEKDDV